MKEQIFAITHQDSKRIIIKVIKVQNYQSTNKKWCEVTSFKSPTEYGETFIFSNN